MTRRRQRELARQTYADHASINSCLVTFESVLALSATEPTDAWSHALRAELARLIGCLGEHAGSAEEGSGLLAEIEVTLGRSHEVSTARRLHRSAARQAEGLSSTLDAFAAGDDRADLRVRGRRLGAAIRRHHEVEADLMLMAFDQDIGTVD